MVAPVEDSNRLRIERALRRVGINARVVQDGEEVLIDLGSGEQWGPQRHVFLTELTAMTHAVAAKVLGRGWGFTVMCHWERSIHHDWSGGLVDFEAALAAARGE